MKYVRKIFRKADISNALIRTPLSQTSEMNQENKISCLCNLNRGFISGTENFI